jgi:hypothetical protein
MRGVKLDVFGRLMLAERTAAGWQLFDLGFDGKRTQAKDVVIPDFISDTELEQYLADIFHESATGKHPGIRRLAD